MVLRREDLEKQELDYFAPYALKAVESRGREWGIAPDVDRTDFQRDRDRIIHCSAFRKLEFKTQVFVLSAGDYHRTRLTHTLEVAQIGRSLARTLALNADVVEAIALAHDLGHTPFGHTGEDGMRECMKDHGGFEHNAQSLRIVELLEERSPQIPGLNLTYEVREGLVKHDTDYDSPSVDDRFMPGKMGHLESQVCDLADEIAYNCADLDDALKYGYLEEQDLEAIPWVDEIFRETRKKLGGRKVRDKFVRFKAIGIIYDMHTQDALRYIEKALIENKIQVVDDVRNHLGRLADFSPEFKAQLRVMKDFLLHRVYWHPNALKHNERGKRFIINLFQEYMERPKLLPFKHQNKLEESGAYRVICDYIAGMTDRFLHEQYRSLFHPETIN
jgi:dGTPase